MSVVTRFAPSPTGVLHIGGARTALFNWLFAHHHKGKFLLRIEDTDKGRSTPNAMDAIRDGLAWLGLDYDGKPILQSTRADQHKAAADSLLTGGAAYRCYLSDADLADLKAKAKASGKAFRSPWRDRTPADARKNVPSVVRLRMPDIGSTTITDKVQGNITIQNDQLDDLVLLRSDGSPTYMLAVVVDDYDMGVSHVIRGDDHLNNTFRQWHIIQALGWQPPVYAHLPLIHNSDGKKMSKRDSTTSAAIKYYKTMGFLPDAMVNYLLRLGWSHGDADIISRAQAINWFDLDAVGVSPSQFDMKKLTAVNAHYIRALSDPDLAKAIIAHVKTHGDDGKLAKDAVQRVTALAPALKKRATTLGDLADMAHFAMHDSPPKVNTGQLKADDKMHLLQLATNYPSRKMDSGAAKDWLTGWLKGNSIAMGDVGPAVRLALTGTTTAPDVASILASLGKQQITARIHAVCDVKGGSTSAAVPVAAISSATN